MMGELVEPISNYAQIKPVLAAQPQVERFLPVGKNMGLALSDDEDAQPSPIFMIGADFAAYRKMFPDGIVAVEGRLLQPGERGMLLTQHLRSEHLFTYTNRWVVPEGEKLNESHLSKDAKENRAELKTMDNVVVLGMSTDNSSTDVRFPVKGIIKYKALDTILGHFAIVDIESYRQCLGYVTAAAAQVQVAKENQGLLKMADTNLDDLFASDNLVVDNSKNHVALPKSLTEPAKVLTSADIENGVYNLVFVKFKDRVSPERALENLNRALAGAHTNTRAISWKKAAGMIGSLTSLIKGSLLVFVGFLFVVAVIIIINTLTMAAMERTSEIGMMRAIGARKSFIRGMFFGETGLLAVVFGGAGLLLGVLVVNVIPLMHITSANDFVQLLYGGDTFHPLLKWADLVVTVLELGVVTLVAAVYPVKVASSIKPLDAIQRD
jgi:putative ABC transport system permease protein